jgi:hypothetical protein
MKRTSTVWMVHARTGMDGIKGRLTLEGSRLVFRPESTTAGESVFDPAGLRRVRRARWSPVLEIYPTSETIPSVVAFYFVKPPSLVERHEGLNFLQRRSARRKAMNTLRRANASKKDDVAGWVEAIRSAGSG